MASRDMKVSVLVQLVDRLTAPLRGLTRGIASVANSIGDLGRRIGIVGGALAALSFTAPLQQAAAWDAQLRDIAITAGKTGGAAETMIADLSKRYQKLAFDTGQAAMDVAKGAKTLISSGMDSTLIERFMPTIAKVATATGATMEDTAKTAFALSDSLKVPADQLEAMLGKLTVAGKLGRFEFRDMARELPELTAQMAKFGIVGKEAVEFLGSSLQIAMLGTANPSQAATNLNNFLTKINAPEAIKKFEKELKVDLTGVMTDATAKGINPIEAVIQKMIDKLKPHQAEIDKIMKKAGVSDKQRENQVRTLLEGTKVGKLYADMQVLGFILPMMQSLDKYKDFKRQLQEAGTDVIINDFATRMKGLEPQLKQFGVLTGAMANRIGLAFGSNLPTAMAGLQKLLGYIDAIDAKFPGLIDGALSWAGALLVLGAGIAVLSPVVSALGATLAVLISIVAAIVSPIGLAATAVAGAALVIQRQWETIGPFFSNLFDNLKQIGQGYVDFWMGLFSGDLGRALDGVGAAWRGVQEFSQNAVQILLSTFRLALVEIDRLFGSDLAGSFQRFRDNVTQALDDAKARMSEYIAAFQALGGLLANAGSSAIQSLWDGMNTKFSELTTWAAQMASMFVTAIGNNAIAFFDTGSRMIAALWDGMNTKFSELTTWAAQMASMSVTAIGNNAIAFFDAGSRMITALWDGMKAKLGELIAWVSQIPAMLVAAIGSIDLSNIIKWPSMPSWLTGPKPGAGTSTPSTMEGFNPTSAPAAPGAGIGGSAGFTRTAGGPAANSNVNVGGRILVEAAEGTRVVNVQSENPAVPVTPNRGTMLGRA